jgi:hypothetical protein
MNHGDKQLNLGGVYFRDKILGILAMVFPIVNSLVNAASDSSHRSPVSNGLLDDFNPMLRPMISVAILLPSLRLINKHIPNTHARTQSADWVECGIAVDLVHALRFPNVHVD